MITHTCLRVFLFMNTLQVKPLLSHHNSTLGLEFIYAQSPESMKGLLTGLFYCVFGIFSGVAVLVFYKFPKSTLNGTNTILWFYVIFTVIGSLGFVGYAIVAFMYVNRVRPAGGPEEETQGRLVRGLYT